MTIAFISLMNVFPWGGSEELWFKAAKFALGKGHTVRTLTQFWEQPAAKIIELQKLGAETNFYHKPNHSIIDKISFRLGVRRRVDEVFADLTADVYVVSNGSTFDFMNRRSIMDSILKKGQPYSLISQHGYENGSILNTEQREYTVGIIEKAEQFFFVSQRNLWSAERQMAYRLRNAALISNPLNIQDTSLIAFPNSSTLLMACVARLECAFKGQDILLQALSGAPWESRDYKLRFYGAGPDGQHLQRLIELYDLHDKVEIMGHVAGVAAIWEANQVLVMPSLSEGTSLSLVEAMLLGRPAVSTNVGDHSKYVLENETGFLAATASAECLHEALEQLWQHRGTLQHLGESASRHARAITDLHPEATLLEHLERQQR